MKYNKINDCDSINVISGLAVSFWVSGCNHYCKGCFNEKTWSFDSGKDYDYEAETELIKAVDNKYITTFSVLGGEPFAPQNRDTVSNMCSMVKLTTAKTVMVWTGYKLEELIAQNVDISDIDFIIDGKFEEDNPTTKKLRGSDNQRMWKNVDGRWEVID